MCREGRVGFNQRQSGSYGDNISPPAGTDQGVRRQVKVINALCKQFQSRKLLCENPEQMHNEVRVLEKWHHIIISLAQ